MVSPDRTTALGPDEEEAIRILLRLMRTTRHRGRFLLTIIDSVLVRVDDVRHESYYERPRRGKVSTSDER